MARSSELRPVIDAGMALWEQDQYEEALEVFRGVLAEHPFFAEVQNKAGLCHAMMGRPAEALRCFDAALEINRSYAEAHLNRGIVLNELGRHDEARQALARAGELDTRDSTRFPSELGNDLADAHARLGDLYLVAQLPQRAADHYAEALAVRPRFQDIRANYARALMQLGEFEGALAALQEVLAERPGALDARIHLGLVHQRLGDREAAVREWRRCVEQAPDDVRARGYLAAVGEKVEAGTTPDPVA